MTFDATTTTTTADTGDNEDNSSEWTVVPTLSSGKNDTKNHRKTRRKNHYLQQQKQRQAVSSLSSSRNSNRSNIVVDDDDTSTTLEEIETKIQSCYKELRSESNLWSAVQDILKEIHQGRQFSCIVCYGIGNFGTSTSNGPIWQLSLALLMRDCLIEQYSKQNHDSDSNNVDVVSMEYYEPIMTEKEEILLKKLNVNVLTKNERGQRSVDDDDNNNNNGRVLFFMPHCPLKLYTNLLHTNWGDQLYRVVIFGNILPHYITNSMVTANSHIDNEKRNSIQILQLLQPYWKEKRIPISKQDISTRSSYFENAFNDCSFTWFERQPQMDDADKPSSTSKWPERPSLLVHEESNNSEVL
jgi:hypothetical protein